MPVPRRGRRAGLDLKASERLVGELWFILERGSNTPAARLAEKIGMQREGLLREHVRVKGGG